MKDYAHIPHETVNQAVEDMANGNRRLTSTAYLQRRIAEIQHDRYTGMKELEEFMNKIYFNRVKQ